MRGLRIGAVICALILAGCGDGGIQSPDFTPVLQKIEVAPATETLALGQSRQFVANGVYTTPPGSATATRTTRLEGVTWSTEPTSLADIDGDGIVTTKAQGRVEVKAVFDGKTSTAILDITGPELVSLVVDPASKTMPISSQQSFVAKGIYTDSSTPRIVTSGVTWTTSNALAGNLSSPVSNPTTFSSGSTAGEQTALQASVVSSSGDTLTATASISVVAATLNGLLRVEPVNPSVAKGNTTQLNAIGGYTDGSEAVINTQVTWTTGDAAIATVENDDPNVDTESAGRVTGVEQGVATITATIKPGVPFNNAQQNSASTDVNVTFSGCNIPLREPEATTAQEIDLLCLLCDVSDENNVIDNDDTNFGEIQVPVGLLDILLPASASLIVNAGQTFEPNTPAGFIIGRPVGQLLNAEVISQLVISTLMDGVPTGDTTSPDGGFNPLGLALLGTSLVGPYESDLALINIPEDAVTKPYNGIKLTFDSGIASAFAKVDVWAACGNAVLPTPAPTPTPAP
jgi:hypothetical protein